MTRFARIDLQVRANRRILANRFRAPGTVKNLFFVRIALRGGQKFANRWFEVIRADLFFLQIDSRESPRFTLRIAGPSKIPTKKGKLCHLSITNFSVSSCDWISNLRLTSLKISSSSWTYGQFLFGVVQKSPLLPPLMCWRLKLSWGCTPKQEGGETTRVFCGKGAPVMKCHKVRFETLYDTS